MAILSDEQVQLYLGQSYLLVSGLIPDTVAEVAETAMWRLLGVNREDPASWVGVATAHQVFDSPELLACYTPEFLAAAALLAGPEENLKAPSRAYAINVFPK